MEDFNFVLKKYLLNDIAFQIADLEDKSSETIKKIEIEFKGKIIYSESLLNLNRAWSELSYRMQALRDNPICAKQEYDNLLDENNPGMNFNLTYDPYEKEELKNDESKNGKLKNDTDKINIEKLNIGISKPRVAILREQGINGQTEMAAVFDMAGFTSVDVHMTDLLGGEFDLKDFNGLVACGGFSYGDVLGAGSGWAKSILFNDYLKDMFTDFFNRSDSFSLGVCNGCQMLSQLKDIIPGAKHWPRFSKNLSEQFEARYVSVEVLASPSIFLNGMEGSVIPVPVAHGEGFADFSSTGSLRMLKRQKLIGLRYVDNYGKNTERYPYNPNGSVEGITGLSTKDGRVTIMMPHPERLFRSVQMSYKPNNLFLSDEGPWLKFFKNARAFLS
jgi:phosphoribosylformylglycinamidine synthase